MEKAAREAMNQYHREWNRKNPDRIRAIKARYWAKKAREKQEAAAREKELERDQGQVRSV